MLSKGSRLEKEVKTMYIQQITTEAVMAILLTIALFALLTYVLEDKPSDKEDIITRKDNAEAGGSLEPDCEVRLHSILIRTGESEQK